MSKKDELYSIFKAIRSGNARYKTYPSDYSDKLNRIMYRRHQGVKYKLQEGGAPTMQQFFDYGQPTPVLPYLFEVGGAATPEMLMSGQQSGQLPMMQMGQSFADNQMQDAARYGYMAKGGSASNSTSTFPNEKLGKFIGSVQGKAKAAVEKELLDAYNAPYSNQEIDQAMMQSLPRADWGGGFQQDATGMEDSNIDYDKISQINSKLSRKAPDTAKSLGDFRNAWKNDYVKQVTISDLDKPYWKSGDNLASYNQVSEYQPMMEEIYNPKYINKNQYGGIPQFYPGGPFEGYKTSGTSMLELKSTNDLNNLMNTVNKVLGMPGQYSMEDVELARQYNDLLQRDFKRLNQALSTSGQSVSINAPGDVQYTNGNSEWTVNSNKDPQGVYTWQNTSKAQPNIQVKGNQVITRGNVQGQPLAVKTGESSYKVNPAVANQQNIQAQDAAAQQVQYPLAGYYTDSPVIRQSTTNAAELNQGNQPNPNTIYEGPQMPVLEITAPRNQRDLSFPPDNPDEIANTVPAEAPIAPPVVGPQGAANVQSEIQYPGIEPGNERFDPSTIPADQQPVATQGNAPVATEDPTAGMTKEQRLEYWRKQRNLPEGTVMLPPAVAMSKAEKDRVIADQKAAEEAKKQAPPSTTKEEEKPTDKKEDAAPSTTEKTETKTDAQTQTQTQTQGAPGGMRVSAIENKWRWSPFGKVDPASGKRHGQAKSTRIEFGYGMPSTGPQQAPSFTPGEFKANAPQQPAASNPPAGVAANAAPTAGTQNILEFLAANNKLPVKTATETPAAPMTNQDAQKMMMGVQKAYGGELYKFVGGGDPSIIDPTGFDPDAYNEMVKQAGPAPEGMSNPTLITKTADYDYGKNYADIGLTGMRALTDLKNRRDYQREAAKLPDQLSAANIFKEQENNDMGDYAVNSGMLGIGNTTTGMRMSKYGGEENSEGNIYFLDEDTIRQIMAMGGTVEYLD